MRVFVTGVNGQLGCDVMLELKKRGYETIGSGRQDTYGLENYVKVDLTDTEQITEALYSVKPDAVIHCAGWTDVDGAEDEENREAVMKTNAGAASAIAKVCKELDCKMVFVSTDYVFDGSGNTPWTPDSENCLPLNFYGKSKLEGEKAVSAILDKFFIVRSSWLYGKNGKNFVKTMLSLADRGITKLRVVDDQIGTPTYTADLAVLLSDMIETEKYGYYNASNEGGYISWADFSEEIFRQTGKSVEIVRVTTEDYGFCKAKRPFNSRLDKTKLTENGFRLLPDWKDALRRYLKQQ